MEKVKVAVVQASPIFLDKRRTFDKLKDLIAQASRHKPQLIVFPEAFIGGYPKGSDFGVRVGLREDLGREEFARYYENALHQEDFQTLSEIVKKAGAYVVVGTIEHHASTLYCTVFYFSPEGQCIGKHRKVMPTAGERYIWGTGDGSTMPVFSSPMGKFGAVICWENYMPLLRYYYYSQGIEIYCAPTVDDRDSWVITMQHIALEGRCFVLSACQYFPKSNLPAKSLRIDFERDPLIRGGSCIISPLGEFIASPHYDGETILTAELDMSLLARGRFDFDVVGHYARPDIFCLQVDTSEKIPVQKTKLK